MKDKVIMAVNHNIFCGKQHHTSLLVLYFYELCCLDFVLVPNYTLCPTNLVHLYPLFRFCLILFSWYFFRNTTACSFPMQMLETKCTLIASVAAFTKIQIISQKLSVASSVIKDYGIIVQSQSCMMQGNITQ